MTEIPITLRTGDALRVPMDIHDCLKVNIHIGRGVGMWGVMAWLLLTNIEMYCFALKEHVGLTLCTPGNALPPTWHHKLAWKAGRMWNRIMFNTNRPVYTMWLRPKEPLKTPDVISIKLMGVG